MSVTATDRATSGRNGVAAPGRCAGCGGSLPPRKRASGRPTKWCSDRCRKETLYSRTCVDCGAMCNTDGRVTHPSERCAACRVEQQKTDPEYAVRMSERGMGRLRWSDEDIFAAIRRSASGGVASAFAYEAMRAADPASAPSVKAIVLRFDRWAVAVERAGLRSMPATRTYERVSEGHLLECVRECAAIVGRRPTFTEYDSRAAEYGWLSGALVRMRFGGWLAACDRALADAAPAAGGRSS